MEYISFSDTIKIIIPSHLHHKYLFFSAFHCTEYSINRHQQLQTKAKADFTAIYAPAPLSFFCLSHGEKINNAKIISNKNIYHNKAYLYWLRLRLKNERRLMGSDVPSPIMTKILRQYVSIANDFYFTIGDWLDMTFNYNKKLEQQKNVIFWLEGNDNFGELIKFLQK